MKDDPLVQIKQIEIEQRRAIMNNPLTLKKIREEIEMLKNSANVKQKSHKKDKKKHKHRHHHRSDS